MKQYSKIWMYDNVIIGNNHIAVNSGWIQIVTSLLEKYGKDKKEVKFFGEQVHIQALQKNTESIAEKVNIQWETLENVNPQGGVKSLGSWFKKWKKDKQQFKAMLQKADQEQPDLIILTTLVASNYQYFFKQIRANPQFNFLLILHGEIEFVFIPTGRIKSKINASLIKKNLQHVPENLKLVCMNDTTRKALLQTEWIRKDATFLVHHPLPVKEEVRREEPQESNLRVIHLGAAYRRKNAQAAFSLSKELTENVELVLLGRVEPELMKLPHGPITFIAKNNQSIPQEEYEQWIRSGHYAISFMKEPEYVYRISGALLDAVMFQLPFVALAHPALNEFFEQAGNIGFLCKNEGELKILVNRLAAKDSELIKQYKDQVENLKQLKNKFFPQSLADDLYKQLIAVF